MLEPMGLPPDVRVLGWGLSLERPTMIRYVKSPVARCLMLKRIWQIWYLEYPCIGWTQGVYRER